MSACLLTCTSASHLYECLFLVKNSPVNISTPVKFMVAAYSYAPCLLEINCCYFGAQLTRDLLATTKFLAYFLGRAVDNAGFQTVF